MPQSKEERELKQLRRLINEYPEEAVDTILETPFWHQGVKIGESYSRESDDTDGKKMGITVMFSQDADSWCEVRSFRGERGEVPPILHRFRSFFGGTNSIRVRTALMVFARAIDLDNEERPDRP